MEKAAEKDVKRASAVERKRWVRGVLSVAEEDVCKEAAKEGWTEEFRDETSIHFVRRAASPPPSTALDLWDALLEASGPDLDLLFNDSTPSEVVEAWNALDAFFVKARREARKAARDLP